MARTRGRESLCKLAVAQKKLDGIYGFEDKRRERKFPEEENFDIKEGLKESGRGKSVSDYDNANMTYPFV